MKERVGIGLPVYNGLPYLQAAVDSVRAQSYPHWKLHIVENCSTDGTLEAIKAHLEALNDSRIVLHRNDEHFSMADNFNRALELIRGYEYFKLFCADDILLANCLEEQVKDLDEHPQASLAASGRWILGSRGQQLFARKHFRVRGEHTGRELMRQCMIAGTNIIGEPAAVLIRSQGLGPKLRMDSTYPYVVDLNLWSEMVKGRTLVFNPAPLAGFRIHPGSATARLTDKIMRDFTAFQEKAALDHGVAFGTWDRWMMRARIRLNSLLRRLIYKYLA